jgi:hypothetical protein
MVRASSSQSSSVVNNKKAALPQKTGKKDNQSRANSQVAVKAAKKKTEVYKFNITLPVELHLNRVKPVETYRLKPWSHASTMELTPPDGPLAGLALVVDYSVRHADINEVRVKKLPHTEPSMLKYNVKHKPTVKQATTVKKPAGLKKTGVP